MSSKMANFVEKNEEVLYSGKPSKVVLELLIFMAAYIGNFWLCIGMHTEKIKTSSFVFFMVCFGLLCWIFVKLCYRNFEYVITNKSIYVSKGIFFYRVDVLHLDNLSEIKLKQNSFYKQLEIGNIVIKSNNGERPLIIKNILNYEEVYGLLKKLQLENK